MLPKKSPRGGGGGERDHKEEKMGQMNPIKGLKNFQMCVAPVAPGEQGGTGELGGKDITGGDDGGCVLTGDTSVGKGKKTTAQRKTRQTRDGLQRDETSLTRKKSRAHG